MGSFTSSTTVQILPSFHQYEDISRKHNNIESEAARSAERADNEEKKIIELEEELKVGSKKYEEHIR